MTPNVSLRLSILWDRIERLLFSPASVDDQRAWCACFIRSLARYWGIEEFAPTGPSFPYGSFELPLPGFYVAYDLSNWANNPPRSSVQMIFEGLVFASQDIDHTFHERGSLLNPAHNNLLKCYSNLATRNEDLMKDICWVLDRLILHPCAHLHPTHEFIGCLGDHLEEPFHDVLHEVRLGLGITNPFASLFQFRINLLLGETPENTQAQKEAERNRIAHLVHYAILTRTNISAGILFGLTR